MRATVGQYADIASHIAEDIKLLRKAGIRLTFLFDGALPANKHATRLRRYRNYVDRTVTTMANISQINNANRGDSAESGVQYWGDLYLIPPLMLEVCFQTLQQIGCDPIVCEAEADELVAQAAHEYSGYVVSKDSDMHIYPRTGKGYIPLDELTISCQGKKCNVSASVYRPQLLSELLHVKLDMMPIIGVLLGNDYLDYQLVRGPITDWCAEQGFRCKNNMSNWPRFVAEFLRRIVPDNIAADKVIELVTENLKDLMARNGATEAQLGNLETAILESVRQYDPLSPYLPRTPEQATKTKETLDLKRKSRHLTNLAATNEFWTNIFIEDLEKASSWKVSRLLRQYLYTLVLHDRQDDESPRVTEYIREKRHIHTEPVQGLWPQEFAENPTSIIQQDAVTRRKILLQMHFAVNEQVQQRLNQLDANLQPLVLCLRYFIHQTARATDDRLKDYEIVGLLTGCIRSLAPILGKTAKVPELLPRSNPPPLKKRNIHITTQFQTVILCSHLLAQALCLPFWDKDALLTQVYDGLHVHACLNLARRGVSAERILKDFGSHVQDVFDSCYSATMYGLKGDVEYSDCIEDAKRTRRKRCSNAGSQSSKKATMQTSRGGPNMFDILSFGCNFDG